MREYALNPNIVCVQEEIMTMFAGFDKRLQQLAEENRKLREENEKLRNVF
jgi:hypothetical protein